MKTCNMLCDDMMYDQWWDDEIANGLVKAAE